MNTKVISAFPGTGKTYFVNNTDLKVLDSDSSKFDKLDFPANYMAHIKENIGKVDIILVSTHKEVRDAILLTDWDFYLVYPHLTLKDEYIQRYKARNSPEAFINLLSKNWFDWINELEHVYQCKHIRLQSGQYLADVLTQTTCANRK